MIKYVMRLLLRVDVPFSSYHKKEWGVGCPHWLDDTRK